MRKKEAAARAAAAPTTPAEIIGEIDKEVGLHEDVLIKLALDKGAHERAVLDLQAARRTVERLTGVVIKPPQKEPG